MIHRAGNTQLLHSLIQCEDEYSIALENLLKASKPRQRLLATYAALSSPGVARPMERLLSALSQTDKVLTAHQAGVKIWNAGLLRLKELNNDLECALDQRQILIASAIAASALQCSKPGPVSSGTNILPPSVSSQVPELNISDMTSELRASEAHLSSQENALNDAWVSLMQSVLCVRAGAHLIMGLDVSQLGLDASDSLLFPNSAQPSRIDQSPPTHAIINSSGFTASGGPESVEASWNETCSRTATTSLESSTPRRTSIVDSDFIPLDVALQKVSDSLLEEFLPDEVLPGGQLPADMFVTATLPNVEKATWMARLADKGAIDYSRMQSKMAIYQLDHRLARLNIARAQLRLDYPALDVASTTLDVIRADQQLHSLPDELITLAPDLFGLALECSIVPSTLVDFGDELPAAMWLILQATYVAGRLFSSLQKPAEAILAKTKISVANAFKAHISTIATAQAIECRNLVTGALAGLYSLAIDPKTIISDADGFLDDDILLAAHRVYQLEDQHTWAVNGTNYLPLNVHLYTMACTGCASPSQALPHLCSAAWGIHALKCLWCIRTTHKCSIWHKSKVQPNRVRDKRTVSDQN